MVWLELIVFFSLGLVLFFFFYAFMRVLPLIHGAPYVPSTDARLEKMLELAQVRKGQRAADLGAGDGKIVIALAKLGAQAHGYEINPFLVLRGRKKIKKLGLQDKAFMHLKSFWRVDYSEFDLLTVYGITYIMNGLEKKLQNELKKGARVVSNYFQFPNWRPKKQEDNILLYIKS